jgi:hypothetical protein
MSSRKEKSMNDEEKLLHEELKEEANAWIREEYARRFEKVRETLEKQAMETIEHMKSRGVTGEAEVAAQTQRSIRYARSELLKEVEFEAFNWIEEEVKKRLKKS